MWTTPGLGNYLLRAGALPRYNGWLPVAKPVHVGVLVSYRSVFGSIYFLLRLLPVGHQARPEVIEITTIPRHFGAIQTPPRSGSR